MYFAGPSVAQVSVSLPDSVIASVDSALRAYMSRNNVPGASVAIARGSATWWTQSYGVANVETRRPVTSGSLFRSASTGKPMTATAALQLWQQRKLDLDAPVQRYCPAFPAREWPVTTRDLLQHRAGIRDKTPAEEFNTRHFTTIAAALDVFKDDPLLARPGTTFRYTSYGYNIVGCVIEGASGIPYGEYMRRFIFDAAGMTHTRIEDSREKLAARVTGYRRDSTSSLRPSLDDDASNRIPAGGFLLTAIDLARFGVATIRGTLLADSTRAMMTRFVPLPDAPPPSEPGGYALGWSVSEWNGEPEWWHGGGSPQISAFIYALPTKQFVVAFLMNLEGAPARGDLAGEIAKIVLGPDAPTRK